MSWLVKARKNGGTVDVKASEHDALNVAQSGSRFEEAVERGFVYLACNQTTVTTQAGLSATTPALTIANRNGSKKIVKIWYAGAGGLVAAAAGAIYWACLGGYSATAVTETTAATVRNSKTGDAGAPNGVAVLAVATLPAAPVAIAVLGGRGGAAAITTAPWFAPQARWFDGALWIREGYNFTIQTSTADTIFCDYIFEVVDA